VAWNERNMRRVKLRDLHVFMTVADAGSMGKAAARLNITQPVVSKAVADLEHVLGVSLLDRSRQGVEATAYGSALIKRGVAMFDELRQGFQDIDFLSDPHLGELRIGVTPPAGDAIVAPVVEGLIREFPRMAFQVVTPANLMRELDDRNIELAIIRMPGSRFAPHFATETLFEDSLVVATGVANPWLRRRKVQLADLKDEPWILSTPGNLAEVTAAAMHAAGFEPPRAAVTTSSHSMRHELLATGHFFAVVPGYSLKLPRPNPAIRAMPIVLPNARHPVCVVSLKSRSHSELAKLFIDRVREITKPLAKGSKS
jgi:DNA-binding transcriptional LysR family regulator